MTSRGAGGRIVIGAAQRGHERDAERADGEPGSPLWDVSGLGVQHPGYLGEPFAQRRGLVVDDARKPAVW